MQFCSACGHELGPLARFCEACGAPLTAAPANEQRKTVTVLFCDLTGSTALGESLDPEPLRALLARYFERMKGIVERLATGDAVNVAARLEQAAAPGEVLLGEPTLQLVRGAVETEEVEPLALKGKAEPVPAFRLLSVQDAPDRRHDTAFVGRERERETLLAGWHRAADEPRCELVTVVGDAGVGKSRLVGEVLASLDARAVRGRCLPYGEG